MSTIEERDAAIDLARYKQAASEVETGNRDDALWYKAFADGGGDENATKAAYIRLRVEQLRRAAVAASAVRVTATQPSPAYTPATPTPTAKPKPNGAKNLYNVLGIAQGANDEQILAGYQTQKSILDARENQGAETKNSLIFIQHAKEVLLDPAKRAAYDARITAEAAQPEKVVREKSSGSRSTSASEPLSDRDLYAAYLGEKNQDYYLNKFEEFDQRGDGMHISWNWPAFFCGGGMWALYRKMYGWFFASIVIGAIFSGVSDLFMRANSPWIAVAVIFTPVVAFGMFANVIYYRRVKTKIAAAQKAARNDHELINLLGEKGGVHSWVWWILWLWLVVAVIGLIVAIAIPAFSESTKKAKAQASGNMPQLSTETKNSPASTDKTGWVRLLCSGSSINATVFQFSEEARLVRIDGEEYVPNKMNEDEISVTNSLRIENDVFTTDYKLNRVNGELEIFAFSGTLAKSHTQYCSLSKTNKF